MHGAGGMLQDLAVVLTVAALTTVLFQRLRLPVVLGYLLAGLIVGPHFPAIPLVASLERVQTLSELGLIVLLFSIGLEFSVRRLVELGGSSVVIATVEVGLMMWLGHLAARQLGWGPRESFFAGGMVGISSTMIVAHTFRQLDVPKKLSDLVFGILIVEDLYALLLIAVLTAVAAGAGLSAGAFAFTAVKLVVFLVLLVALGLLVVPRFLSYVARQGSRETTLVASVGTCFGLALVASRFGYSVALGAFIAGLLAAESGEGRRIEVLVRPLRDVFGAIFFVSIGMLVDPALFVRHWPAILVFSVVVLAGKVCGVTLGALLVGRRTETAVRAGMSLAQVGEFSFLIAGVALPLGEEAAMLPAVAVAVGVVTAFTTPLFASRGERAGRFVDHHLPARLQTYLSLYATWLDEVRARKSEVTHWSRVRGLVLWLAADVAFLVAIVISVAVSAPRITTLAQELISVGPRAVGAGLAVLELVALAPFAIGIFRCVRGLVAILTTEVLPLGLSGGLDLAAAPRRAMIAGLQLTLLCMVALPVVALTGPFLPLAPGVGVIVVGLSVAFWALWRSASNLEGHVRAGAAMILEVLRSQSREASPPSLERVQGLLPGLGNLTPVSLTARDGAVRRTLGALDLHARTGAKVLCVSRGREGLIAPTDDLELQVSDVLTLVGGAEAIEAARKLLAAPETVDLEAGG